jgi:hypothetical protein
MTKEEAERVAKQRTTVMELSQAIKDKTRELEREHEALGRLIAQRDEEARKYRNLLDRCFKAAAFIILIVPSLLLGGCAPAPVREYRTLQPNPEQISAAEQQGLFGECPQDLAKLAQDYMRTMLKDPYTVRDFAVVGPAAKAWYYGPGPTGRGHQYGWAFPVQYNAKNSYGGYTGLRTHMMFAPGGREVLCQDPTRINFGFI